MCEAGTYKNNEMTTCMSCVDNHVSAGVGATLCGDCGVGHVSNQDKTLCGKLSSLLSLMNIYFLTFFTEHIFSYFLY